MIFSKNSVLIIGNDLNLQDKIDISDEIDLKIKDEKRLINFIKSKINE